MYSIVLNSVVFFFFFFFFLTACKSYIMQSIYYSLSLTRQARTRQAHSAISSGRTSKVFQIMYIYIYILYT